MAYSWAVYINLSLDKVKCVVLALFHQHNPDKTTALRSRFQATQEFNNFQFGGHRECFS